MGGLFILCRGAVTFNQQALGSSAMRSSRTESLGLWGARVGPVQYSFRLLGEIEVHVGLSHSVPTWTLTSILLPSPFCRFTGQEAGVEKCSSLSEVGSRLDSVSLFHPSGEQWFLEENLKSLGRAQGDIQSPAVLRLFIFCFSLGCDL